MIKDPGFCSCDTSIMSNCDRLITCLLRTSNDQISRLIDKPRVGDKSRYSIISSQKEITGRKMTNT